MFSKFALLTSLLLASVALAVPASLVEIPPAHRSEDHQTPPINHVTSRADAPSNQLRGKRWAGIVMKGDGFFSISSTINIPYMQWLPSTSPYIGIWLSVDDALCPIFFRLGFVFDYDSIKRNSSVVACYEGTGTNGLIDTEFPVHPGDKILVSIIAFSENVVALSLRNHTAPLSKPFEKALFLGPGKRFCGTSLGWLVEAKFRRPLPDFGRATFTDINIGRFPQYTSILTRFTLDIQNTYGTNITSSSITDSGNTVNVDYLNRLC